MAAEFRKHGKWSPDKRKAKDETQYGSLKQHDRTGLPNTIKLWLNALYVETKRGYHFALTVTQHWISTWI
jgi:hypothetical protein